MTNQFLSMGAALCCSIGMGACAWAAEPEGFTFNDLELGVSSAPMPKIKEYTTNAAGSTTEYDWEGMRSNGVNVDLIGLHGHGSATGGWEYGLGLSVSSFNIMPSYFSVGGTTYNNASSHGLAYRSFGFLLLGGYEYGILDLNDFRGFLEITPMVGAGVAWAEDQVAVLNGAGGYATQGGYGYYLEAGLRAGAYITEKRWIYGITATVTDRVATVKMTFPQGDSTTMDLDRVGFGAGVVAGYRF